MTDFLKIDEGSLIDLDEGDIGSEASTPESETFLSSPMPAKIVSVPKGPTVRVMDVGGDSFVPEGSVMDFLADHVARVKNAKYLIQVEISHEATTRDVTPGTLMLWQYPPASLVRAKRVPATKSLIHLCPNPDCNGIIPLQNQTGFRWTCDTCGLQMDPEKASAGRFYVRNMERWANSIAGYYYGPMEEKADILVFRRRVSLKEVTHDILNRAHGAEERFMESKWSGNDLLATEGWLFLNERLQKDSRITGVAKQIEIFLRGG